MADKPNNEYRRLLKNAKNDSRKYRKEVDRNTRALVAQRDAARAMEEEAAEILDDIYSVGYGEPEAARIATFLWKHNCRKPTDE